MIGFRAAASRHTCAPDSAPTADPITMPPKITRTAESNVD